MPRFRFRMRGILVAVAVVGILLGLHQWMSRRARRFHAISESHRSRLSLVISGPVTSEGDFLGVPSVLDRDLKTVSRHRARKELWHYTMSVRYKRAAERPWLPVPPDPPEPY
ncbi:hypothetical protein [Singulisphaera acidiphila]|uniref:Uncharacterized protein n=1 Tax=Singulisphaera acidiphila (strain ATCC BAA-1392 / DSM 18658 / VKM B-2454 / MOB10) TaxID=886293 RepID=L0DGR0_SINAD|nr:hypothetical protein [Singulisphaera acidiphila]AGA28447.1 hypothetical protein Sinac_4246 [Singulisphaera acidiphila DSM 18658]